MSDARQWLAPRVQDAPEQLRARMFAALAAADGRAPVHERLALAASGCISQALRDHESRASALDLLAADALLTHACEAAAEVDSDTLATFAATWSAQRFEHLLPGQAR